MFTSEQFMGTIMQAWDMAGNNPGKKIAVSMSDGVMVLTFNVSPEFRGHEIGEIEIDGEKQNV